jgi:mono/diheme cytochrome c family protein
MKRGTRVLCAIVCAAAGTLYLVAEQASRTSLDGVYTEDQAKRGREIYGEQCVECHGRELEGKYESAALADDQFRSNWEGQTLLELFDRIRVTMSGDAPGMISTGPPKPLTREQSADLVAFLLWFNGAPAGKAELSTKAEVLREIRFQSPKQ